MTYQLNLAENDIKRIIAEYVGNCKPENVSLRASKNESFYGGTVVTASVTLNGPFTTDTKKKEAVVR